jgi:threonine dehydrogenase-like Zn-dependent dehydrogenase
MKTRRAFLISHKWPLDKVEEAFRTLENKPKDYIKGVVIP